MGGRSARIFSWLGSHELAVLLGWACLAAGLWLFGRIASEVKEGETQGFDRTVMLAMRNPGDLSPKGPAVIQEAARDMTALGGISVLTLLTLSAGVFLWLDGKKHLTWFVYGAVTSGLVVSLVLKEAFQRPRPDLVPYGAEIATASFPSGHSMLSAVTYLTLGALLARAQPRKRLKAFFLLLAVLLTFVIGLSRVYLGVHWPTDVLAGWTAGGSWAILCWLVARRLQRAHTLEDEG